MAETGVSAVGSFPPKLPLEHPWLKSQSDQRILSILFDG